MNTRIKIGIAISAITLSTVSFFAGSIHTSNKLSKAEADLIVKEMQLKTKSEKLDKSIDEFNDLSQKYMASNNEAVIKLTKLESNLRMQESLLNLQKNLNELPASPEPKFEATQVRITNTVPAVTTEKVKRWIEPSQVEADRKIKTAAESKWGEDYSMVQHEIKKQSEAFIQVRDANRRGNLTTRNIIDNAAEKWPSDYSMMVYEINKQVEAYNSINR